MKDFSSCRKVKFPHIVHTLIHKCKDIEVGKGKYFFAFNSVNFSFICSCFLI